MPLSNIKLSSNFTLAELAFSQAAVDHGIENLPNQAEIAHLRTLCEKILQPARDALGPLRINSGFRSEQVNKIVGGVSNSDHRLGFAADVVPFEVGTRDLAVWVVKNIKNFDQVILEFGTLENPRWVHLSAAPKNRRQVLRAESVNGKTKYTAIQL
jgi:hypothetical protein